MSDELRRIERGPTEGEVPEGFLVRVMAYTEDPNGTLSRVRDALRIVIESGPESHGTAAKLPDWFLAACAPEPTVEEADNALAAWRDDPIGHADDPWTAMNWLYCFEPDERSWWWWDATAIGEDGLAISVVVEGHPFGADDLRWLLIAAGAREVSVDA